MPIITRCIHHWATFPLCTLTEFLFFLFFFVSGFRFSALLLLPSASSMSVSPILNFPHCSSLPCWVKRWIYADGISYREGLHWWFPGKLSSGSEIGDAKTTHRNFMKPSNALSCGQEGLPRWLRGKESTCRRCRRHGFALWVRKIPWRRAWQPTPVFLSGEAPGRV